MTFHGEERFRHVAAAHDHEGSKTVGHEEEQQESGHHPVEPHESPWVVTVPLIALAIPSLLVGYFTVGPVLFGSYFGHSIFVLPANDVIGEHGARLPRAGAARLAGLPRLRRFWLMAAGFITAWVCFLWRPSLADAGGEHLRLAAHDPGREVLLRLGQREGPRAAHARRRLRAVEGGRPGHHRRRAGQRLRGDGGLVRRRRAHGADRLPLFLRLLDGDRPGGAARLVPGARLKKARECKHICSPS